MSLKERKFFFQEYIYGSREGEPVCTGDTVGTEMKIRLQGSLFERNANFRLRVYIEQDTPSGKICSFRLYVFSRRLMLTKKSFRYAFEH